mmetsp:Transcript_60362/g.176436  ORF Transcript_60362/g.176436 Transcript_60362/m.176436 type:complete len:150 (+) Transcript_60362:79-528(+)
MALNSSDSSLGFLEARRLTGKVNCGADHCYYFGEVGCTGEVLQSSPQTAMRVVRIGVEESHRKALEDLGWFMTGGYLCIEGESVGKDEGRQKGNQAPDEAYDVAGRRIDVKKHVRPLLRMQKKAIASIGKKLTSSMKKKTLIDEMMGQR